MSLELASIRTLLLPEQTVPIWAIGVSVTVALSLILCIGVCMALLVLRRRIDIYLAAFAFGTGIAITSALVSQGDFAAVLTFIPTIWMLHRGAELLMPLNVNPRKTSIRLIAESISVSIALCIGILFESPPWLLNAFLMMHAVIFATRALTSSNPHIQGAFLTYGSGVFVIQFLTLLAIVFGLENLIWLGYTLTGVIMLLAIGYARLSHLFVASLMVTQAETEMAKDGHFLYRVQLRRRISQIVSAASHKLGTPFTILSGLKFRIDRECPNSFARDLNADIDTCLANMAEAKDMLTRVEHSIRDRKGGIRDIEQLIHDDLELFQHSLSGVRVFVDARVKSHAAINRNDFSQLLTLTLGLHVALLQSTMGRSGEYIKISVHEDPSSLILTVSQRDATLMPDLQSLHSAKILARSLGVKSKFFERQSHMLVTCLQFPI